MLFQNRKIICAGMNLASSLSLARAVFDAGGIPTMLLVNMADKTDSTLQTLYEYSKGREYVIGTRAVDLDDDCVVESIQHFPPSHIELITYPKKSNHLKALEIFKSQGVRVIVKTTQHRQIPNSLVEVANGITICLPGGAGLSLAGPLDVHDLQEFIVTNNLGLILSGGLYDNAEIDPWRANFPDAYFALGTRFALSEESPLHNDVKLKILNHKDKWMSKRISSTETRNLINFSSKQINSFSNNTDLLAEGLYNRSVDVGIAYIGSSIARVTRVEPVADIIASVSP